MEGKLPRRILMTADPVGGVWVYTLELSRALAMNEIEVYLATMGAPLSDAQKNETREIPKLHLFESLFKLEWMDDPWEEMEKVSLWLSELEAVVRPDIIHLNGYVHAALPWQTPVLVVGHSCVISWWYAVHNSPLPHKWERYREEVKKGISSCDCLVAPSFHMLNCLKTHYGLPNRSEMIYNGRSPERFLPQAKYPFIFSAGRLWDEAKNMRALDKAAKGINWPVYMAGETRSPGTSDKIESNGFHNTRKLGQLSGRALSRWLGRASIYVLPAHYEPFGLSVLEAALAGCALVLGDIESLRELWDECALFVQPDDIKGLRRAINRLIAEPATMRRKAAFARKRALELNPVRMAEEYMALYSELLEKESGRTALDSNEVAEFSRF